MKPLPSFVILAMLLAGCGGPTPSSESANVNAPEPGAPPTVEESAASAPDEPELIQRALEPWTGDFDEMVDRRAIRALVPYSRTFYFVDERGRQRGVSYDALTEFQQVVNAQVGDKTRPVHVVIIPVRRDQLFQYLADGRGDLALGNVTVTPEREKLVDFSDPVASNVNEVLVTGPGAPPVSGLDDLAGKEVFARRSSSYFEHLERLNEGLKRAGKPAVRVTPVDELFEDEDLLEMANAGVFPMIVVDQHLATLWGTVFPEVKIHPDVTINTGGAISWAVRKNCPKFAETVNGFVATHKQGTAFGNMVIGKYFGNAKWIKNSASEAELKKFRAALDLFKKYGNEYQFDWLLVAAQAYQESGIDQSVHSPVGAVGVMQVLPSTAAGAPIGIPDIETNMDNNIHAGVKYMRFMMNEYFKDAEMDEVNKCLFAFASYNGGPARIAKLRKEAAERGLDPNIWFQNVELVVAQRIGRETVTYVRNIYKYYVAYRLVVDRNATKGRAKDTLRRPAA